MILLGLGANLPSAYGAPEQTLKAAIDLLAGRDDMSVLAMSSIWLTAPVPISDQPWYHNAVIQIETELEPRALLSLLKGVEADFGREYAERNAPRVIDMDILAYHDVVYSSAVLNVPHPRMHERAFVLYPLQEVAKDWVHPVLTLSVSQLMQGLPADQEIKRLEKRVA